MKRLIIIFLFIPLLSQAQPLQMPVYHKEHKEAWKTIATYTTAIAFNAISDGLRDSNHKQAAHIFEGASYAVLLTSPLFIHYQKSEWLTYLSTYLGIRFMSFDYMYNATRGLPMNYMGGTTYLYDKALKPLADSHFLFVPRIMMFSVTINFAFKNL